MQANPSRFQLIIISHSLVDISNAMLRNDYIVFKLESQVKMIEVMLDSKSNLNHLVSVTCTEAARQLNALARISRSITTTSLMII